MYVYVVVLLVVHMCLFVYECMGDYKYIRGTYGFMEYTCTIIIIMLAI